MPINLFEFKHLSCRIKEELAAINIDDYSIDNKLINETNIKYNVNYPAEIYNMYTIWGTTIPNNYIPPHNIKIFVSVVFNVFMKFLNQALADKSYLVEANMNVYLDYPTLKRPLQNVIPPNYKINILLQHVNIKKVNGEAGEPIELGPIEINIEYNELVTNDWKITSIIIYDTLYKQLLAKQVSNNQTDSQKLISHKADEVLVVYRISYNETTKNLFQILCELQYELNNQKYTSNTCVKYIDHMVQNLGKIFIQGVSQTCSSNQKDLARQINNQNKLIILATEIKAILGTKNPIIITKKLDNCIKLLNLLKFNHSQSANIALATLISILPLSAAALLYFGISQYNSTDQQQQSSSNRGIPAVLVSGMMLGMMLASITFIFLSRSTNSVSNLKKVIVEFQKCKKNEAAFFDKMVTHDSTIIEVNDFSRNDRTAENNPYMLTCS